MKRPKAGTPPAPYKIDLMRHGRVIFSRRYDLHADAFFWGEKWKAQCPEIHTYQITDYTDRQPGAR